METLVPKIGNKYHALSDSEIAQNHAMLDKWQKEKARQHDKEERYRLQVKEYFRSHALDLPYQNKEFPEESRRAPSSEN